MSDLFETDVPALNDGTGRRATDDSNAKAEQPQSSVKSGSGTARHPKAEARPLKNAATSKADVVLKKLRASKGVTIEVIMEATGWQAHSVRGFLSATVRKKLALNLVSEIGKDGTRRYRIVDAAAAT